MIRYKIIGAEKEYFGSAVNLYAEKSEALNVQVENIKKERKRQEELFNKILMKLDNKIKQIETVG
jgi:hypothetical protein